jgi:hypothetical protein
LRSAVHRLNGGWSNLINFNFFKLSYQPIAYPINFKPLTLIQEADADAEAKSKSFQSCYLGWLVKVLTVSISLVLYREAAMSKETK